MTNRRSHEILVTANALRESVIANFPAPDFQGAVTPVDGDCEQDHLDEERALFEALKGRSWREVSPELIYRFHGGLPLLTAEAFCYFLPAWLLQTLPALDGENQVREFVIYCFGPRPGRDETTAAFQFKRIALLGPQQLKVVRSLMEFFSEIEPSKLVRARAVEAVSLIDEVIRKHAARPR